MYNSIVSKLAIPEEDTSRQVYYDYLKDFLDSKNADKDIDLNSVLPFIPGGVYLSNNEFKKEDDIEISKPKKESKLSFSFSSKDDFKNTMLPIYENILLSKGLDPKFAKSLVAQDGLESAWGSKPSGDNNFGGVKSRYDKKQKKYIDPGILLKTREVVDGKDEYLYQMFRNFASLEDYAEYKVNLLNSKRYKAFDGGLEDFSRRVSAGGYATDPRYKEVLDKVIRNVRNGGILKAQHGVLLDSYSDPNHYYDYENGEYDEQSGHWYSRNPASGLELKNPNHPTHKISQYYDKKEGLKRFRNVYSDRYYTLEDWNSGRFMPGMEEVDYDLMPNPFDDRIGRYMNGHTKEDEYDRWIGYSDIIRRASKEFGVPEKIMIHLGSTESHFNPEAYNEDTGASGIYQITPESLQWFKDKGHWRDDLSKDENNIRAGAFLLRYFKNRYKDWEKALMGYKGIDKDIINNPSHPDYHLRRIKNKIDYLTNYIK